MSVISGLPLWILLFSVLLLAPPFDKGVIVGDFSPDEYTGKLNPLSDSSIVVDDVYFPSHGEKCHAWLYSKPPNSSSTVESSKEENEEEEETAVKKEKNAVVPPPPPVVVMAPGFGTQKDSGLDRYAERFVQAGYAVFMFDYRNFAASTGRPRNWVSPKRHIEDYNAALDYIESMPNELMGKLDASRIVLWGTSFSGGHVLEVASQRSQYSDRKNSIKGVVSQVPHLSGKVASKIGLQKRGIFKMARLALAALQDKARDFVGLPPVSAKIIGSDHDLAMMSVTREDHARYLEKQPPLMLGGWINQTPARILLEVRFYNPIETLKKNSLQQKQEHASGTANTIQVPVLLIGASLDDLCPPDLIEEASTLIPNSKLIIKEGTHFQIYEPQNYVYVADEMVKFYNDCLN